MKNNESPMKNNDLPTKRTPRKYVRKEGGQAAQALAGQPGPTGARGEGLTARGKKKRGGTDVTAGDGTLDSNLTVFASNPFEDDQPIKLAPNQHYIHNEPPPLNHLQNQPMHAGGGHMTPGPLQPHQHYATSGGIQAPVQNHHMHPHHHAHHQPGGPYGAPPQLGPQMQQPPPHHAMAPSGGPPQMMRAGPPPGQSHVSVPPPHSHHHHQMENHMMHQQQPMMTSPSPPRPQIYAPGAGGYGSQSPMNAIQTTQQQQLPPPPPPSMTPGQQQPQHYPPGGPPQQQLPPHQTSTLNCFHCRQPIFPHQHRILCRPGCENYYHRDCSGLTELAHTLLMNAEPAAQWACNNCFQSDRVQIPYTRPYTQHQEMDNRQSLWS